MSRRKLVLTVVISLLIFSVFVLARFPAEQALAIASRATGQVFASNVQGTVWQGRADNIYVQVNQELLDLGKTTWQLSPWSLLIAKLNLKVDAQAPGQKIKASVVAGMSRAVITDAEITMDAQRILALYPLPIRLQGMIELNLAEAVLHRQGIEALSGNVLVKDMVFTFQRPVNLGTYAARLGVEGSFVTADISDIDATVKVEGRVMASLADREYRNKLLITPTPVADLSVEQTLQMVAKKQSDGSFQFEHNGRF